MIHSPQYCISHHVIFLCNKVLALGFKVLFKLLVCFPIFKPFLICGLLLLFLFTWYLPVSSKSLLDSSSIFIWNILSSFFFLPNPNPKIITISTIFMPIVSTPLAVCPHLWWILSSSKVTYMDLVGFRRSFKLTHLGLSTRLTHYMALWFPQSEHSKKRMREHF